MLQLSSMQKLINIFKPKLAGLVKHYPHISFSINDESIALNIDDVFKKLGFITHSQPKQQLNTLVRNIALWLNNGNLVLLQYQPSTGDTSLVNVLRAIKKCVPNISFKNFIPVMMISYSSKRQLETFKLLAAFDIQYISFLTQNAPAERNIEEIMSDLFNFSKTVEGNFVTDDKAASEKIDLDSEKIEKYKELISHGNEFMQNAKYEEAINYFSDAIALKPDFEVLINRGDAYYQISKYIQALNDFKEANKLAQSTPDPYAKIGACCFQLIKENIKNKTLEKAVKWFDLGIKHFNMAESLVDKMISENIDSPERLPKTPYSTITSALAESDIKGLGIDNMEKQVSELIARVIKKTDSVDYLSSEIDIDNRIDQAILLVRNKKFEKAEKIFRTIIDEDPSQVGPVFNNFAVELRKNGQEGKAFDIYIELLKYDISDKNIIIENLKRAGTNYAAHLRKNFKQKEAIPIYKTILGNNPQSKEWVLCDLAMTYLEMQNRTQASFRIMEAIYIDPGLMTKEKFKPYMDLVNLKKEMVKKLSELKSE